VQIQELRSSVEAIVQYFALLTVFQTNDTMLELVLMQLDDAEFLEVCLLFVHVLKRLRLGFGASGFAVIFLLNGFAFASKNDLLLRNDDIEG
jgi:hypothetical protein